MEVSWGDKHRLFGRCCRIFDAGPRQKFGSNGQNLSVLAWILQIQDL